jgi:hypothetical protein
VETAQQRSILVQLICMRYSLCCIQRIDDEM